MFDKFIDEQPLVVSFFKKIIKEEKFSHAYLIDTNNYSKADQLVMTFVKALLCPNNHIDTSNYDCDFCRRIDHGNCGEVKIIEPNGTWIKKEQLQQLQDDFSTKSIESNKRIYIIKDCDKMNKYSANSILKFLEEPVDNIVAILMSNDINKLLDTIISRCQVIRLNADIDNQLLVSDNTVDYLLNFIMEFELKKTGCIVDIKKIWHSYFNNRDLVGQAIDLLIKYYYDVLLVLSNKDIIYFVNYNNHVLKVSNFNTVDSILHKLECLIKARSVLDYNLNLNLFINKLIIDMGSD